MTLATDQNMYDHGLSQTAQTFLTLRDRIMSRWEKETRERIEGADQLLSPVLTNTLPAFLDNIAEALSPGYPRDDATSNTNAAAVHGGERARMTPFGPDQIVHEYQILRESIVAETEGRLNLTAHDWSVIGRSIDRAVREAVREFASMQDDLRRKLAAILSHDMRTPLGVIRQGAELINIAPDLPLAKNAAGKIVSNAQRLERMMVDLLDALTSKVDDTLALDLSAFDIADLLDQVRGDYAHSAPGRIQVSAEGIEGHWCRHALRRAVENLVNNSLKYGDGGDISLVASQARGRLMLSIHNRGIVIPKERHRAIFEYFARADASNAVEGWGLGLPFVKKVAESHGGSVAVDSSAQTGTTFLIDIPVDCRPFVATSEGR
jgi:signal transduction histidine kinase